MFRKIPLIILAFTLAIGLSSCKDDNDEDAEITVSDASDLVMSCMENGNFGVTEQLSQSVKLFEGLLTPTFCGFSDDTTVLKYYGGQAIQYDYSLHYQWIINCVGGALTSTDVDFTTTGTNATSLLSGNMNGTGDFNIGSIEPITTEYIITGTYDRTGRMKSKVRNENEFDYSLTLTFSNLKLDKDTYIVSSGSAAVALSCTLVGGSNDGQSWTFSGTITFNGNQNCVLTLNGANYTFQL
jgi:hypothetical protein